MLVVSSQPQWIVLQHSTGTMKCWEVLRGHSGSQYSLYTYHAHIWWFRPANLLIQSLPSHFPRTITLMFVRDKDVYTKGGCLSHEFPIQDGQDREQ